MITKGIGTNILLFGQMSLQSSLEGSEASRRLANLGRQSVPGAGGPTQERATTELFVGAREMQQIVRRGPSCSARYI